jgi:phosphoribosylformylglycinamidine synthase
LTDDAPIYERPLASDAPPTGPSTELPPPGDLQTELLTLLASPNVGSKRWIWRQFDHIVRGGTVVAPGADAAVVRVLCERDAAGALASSTAAPPTEKLLAFAVDCNGRFVEKDPFVGAAMAVAETCRNLVCSGAEPLGMTDCLNFGNPERPDVMRQVSLAIDGIAAACQKLGVPIVSGNVSLYNETDGRAILPTPTVAAVGLVGAMNEVVTPWWKHAGDLVFLIGAKATDGERYAGLSGSEYAASRLAAGGRACPRGCPPPSIDLDLERQLQRLVLELARKGHLASAHDVSDGGLAVALAECAAGGPDGSTPLGARIDLELAHDVPAASLDVASLLFGEQPSRVVVSVRPDAAPHLVTAAERAGVPVKELGVVGGASLSVSIDRPHAASGHALAVATFVTHVSELGAARARALSGIVGD